MPVTAAYAPSMIIEAVMMLPRSTARSVAGTSTTWYSSRSNEPSNTVELTSTRLPGRSFARVGSEKSWCMKIADHVVGHRRGRADGAVGDHQGGLGVTGWRRHVRPT